MEVPPQDLNEEKVVCGISEDKLEPFRAEIEGLLKYLFSYGHIIIPGSSFVDLKARVDDEYCKIVGVNDVNGRITNVGNGYFSIYPQKIKWENFEFTSYRSMDSFSVYSSIMSHQDINFNLDNGQPSPKKDYIIELRFNCRYSKDKRPSFLSVNEKLFFVYTKDYAQEYFPDLKKFPIQDNDGKWIFVGSGSNTKGAR